MQATSTSGPGARSSDVESLARIPVADRVPVLVVSLLAVGAGFGALFAGLFGWDPAALLSEWMGAGASRSRLVLAAAGAVLALVGAASMRPALRSAGVDRTIVRATSLGEIHLSLRAIQTLARRAAAQVQGIREVEVAVGPSSSGDVNVRVVLTVAPDQPIPELCDQVQARIDQYLRQTAGVSCGQIRLVVRSISREGHRARPD